MDNSSVVFYLVLSLLICAFFAAMELAFLSSNRLKVELDKSKGTLYGKILGVFYARESFFIALLLLGNNIGLVIFGIYAAIILEPLIASWGILEPGIILVIQTILSTLIVLSLSEFLPKALVQINPNGFLRISTLPMFLFYLILFVPTQIIMWISSIFLRILNANQSNSTKVFSKIDLEHYVQDISARIKKEQELGNEMMILQNALDFSAIKARDCMIPRTEIVAIDVEDSIESLRKSFVDTGLSKVLVYRTNIDNIIGYVHSFEMFKKPSLIKQILLPINFVPAAVPGKELLELFTKKSGNIAVVVDEYGGTAGIVTIEDVIEEIFGEIEDEHDVEERLAEKISPKEYRFSGRITIDQLNDEYHLKLPESDEYETLGGLVIHHLESIPEAGSNLLLDDKNLVIEKVSDRKIEVVRVILM